MAGFFTSAGDKVCLSCGAKFEILGEDDKATCPNQDKGPHDFDWNQQICQEMIRTGGWDGQSNVDSKLHRAALRLVTARGMAMLEENGVDLSKILAPEDLDALQVMMTQDSRSPNARVVKSRP